MKERWLNYDMIDEYCCNIRKHFLLLYLCDYNVSLLYVFKNEMLKFSSSFLVDFDFILYQTVIGRIYEVFMK